MISEEATNADENRQIKPFDSLTFLCTNKNASENVINSSYSITFSARWMGADSFTVRVTKSAYDRYHVGVQYGLEALVKAAEPKLTKDRGTSFGDGVGGWDPWPKKTTYRLGSVEEDHNAGLVV